MTQTTVDMHRKAHLDHLFDNARDRILNKQSLVTIKRQVPYNDLEAQRLNRYVTLLNKTLHTTSESYARLWQVGIANNILHKLPAEIRNMVYEELNLMIEPDKDKELGNRTSYDDRLLNVKDYPHYFDTSFMGFEFVRELSMNFYFLHKFSIRNTKELEEFLNEDRFKTTCVPSQHIRYLAVNVSLELFRPHENSLYKPWSNNTFATPLKQHFVDAVHEIKKMKLIEVTKNATKTLVLKIDCEEYDGGPKFAEALVPVVYDLKAKGWTIIIEITKAPSNSSVAQMAAHFNYEVPRKEWQNKIKENSVFVDDDPDKSRQAKQKQKKCLFA